MGLLKTWEREAKEGKGQTLIPKGNKLGINWKKLMLHGENMGRILNTIALLFDQDSMNVLAHKTADFIVDEEVMGQDEAKVMRAYVIFAAYFSLIYIPVLTAMNFLARLAFEAVMNKCFRKKGEAKTGKTAVPEKPKKQTRFMGGILRRPCCGKVEEMSGEDDFAPYKPEPQPHHVSTTSHGQSFELVDSPPPQGAPSECGTYYENNVSTLPRPQTNDPNEPFRRHSRGRVSKRSSKRVYESKPQPVQVQQVPSQAQVVDAKGQLYQRLPQPQPPQVQVPQQPLQPQVPMPQAQPILVQAEVHPPSGQRPLWPSQQQSTRRASVYSIPEKPPIPYPYVPAPAASPDYETASLGRSRRRPTQASIDGVSALDDDLFEGRPNPSYILQYKHDLL